MIIIAETMIPKGFINKELTISPLKIDTTALDVPHEGQGMLVALLKRQTVESKSLDFLEIYLKKNNQL
jgi:hypothetical protein